MRCMSFRRATAADLPQVLALHRAFYEHEGYPFDELRSMRALRELGADDFLGRILVAERDRRLAA